MKPDMLLHSATIFIAEDCESLVVDLQVGSPRCLPAGPVLALPHRCPLPASLAPNERKLLLIKSWHEAAAAVQLPPPKYLALSVPGGLDGSMHLSSNWPKPY